MRDVAVRERRAGLHYLRVSMSNTEAKKTDLQIDVGSQNGTKLYVCDCRLGCCAV
jgi:hypothetical protein